MVGGLRDVITCAEFQIEMFMGYDFTGGRIFDFPIDFSMGLTTVQRYCAACDEYRKLKYLVQTIMNLKLFASDPADIRREFAFSRYGCIFCCCNQNIGGGG